MRRSSPTWSSSQLATCPGSSSSIPLSSATTDPAGPSCTCTPFPRNYPTLAVAGLLQPDSGLFPLVHWQTVAIARWLRLRQTAPQQAEAFSAQVAAGTGRRWSRAKVKDSSRHWFEVSHIDYLRALQRTIDSMEPNR